MELKSVSDPKDWDVDSGSSSLFKEPIISSKFPPEEKVKGFPAGEKTRTATVTPHS